MNRDNYKLVKDLLNSDLVLPAIKPNTISLNNNIKLYIFDNKDLEINKIEFFFITLARLIKIKHLLQK